MSRIERKAPLLLRALALFAGLALAGCSVLTSLQKEKSPVAMAPPPMLRAIPLQELTLATPRAPDPEPPRVASVMPKPKEPVNPIIPAKKPISPREEAEAAAFAPGDLVGSDFSSVLQVLRRPDAVQNSALSVVWTYSPPECTLQLYFYPDIQTKTFHLLKYDLKSDTGEKPADRALCMHDIMAAKSDEFAIP